MQSVNVLPWNEVKYGRKLSAVQKKKKKEKKCKQVLNEKKIFSDIMYEN